MRTVSCMSMLALILSPDLSAQVLAEVAPGESAGTETATFERLEGKNRSRFFSESPGPGGELYFYYDDHDLISEAELSPEVEVTPTTRRVTTVISLYSSNQLRLTSENEAVIGTVRLRGASSTSHQLEVKSVMNSVQPIRVEIRPRSEPALD